MPFSSFACATTSHISFSYAARQRMQNRARLLKQYQTHLKKQASYIVEGNAQS
ncbi:C40 family peptidase, partial [Shigella sonnei]